MENQQSKTIAIHPLLVGRNRLSRNATVALLLALLVSLSACQKKVAADAEPEVVVSVKIAKVERQPIKAQASALGTIFPREQATVSANVNAQIKQMALLKNKSVRAGDVIAVLNSRDLQAQRGEVAAALQEAELNLRAVSTGTIPQTRTQDEKAVND